MTYIPLKNFNRHILFQNFRSVRKRPEKTDLKNSTHQQQAAVEARKAQKSVAEN